MTTDGDQLSEKAGGLMKAEQWALAIELLEQNNTIVREDSSLSWDLGWAYFRSKQFESAATWLGRACELAPQNAVARWAFAEVCGVLGDTSRAEHELLLSLAFRDSYRARRALGYLYHRTNRLEDAEAVYLEAIRLRPQDVNRLETYADFLDDCGRTDEAQEYYAKAKQAGGG